MFKKFGVLAVILAFFILGSQKSYAETSIDLSNPDNYTLRFDGAVASDQLSSHGLELVDIDNNGAKDVVVYNTIKASSKIYVILDSLLDSFIESGVKNIDLLDQNNYSLKITGAYLNPFGLGFLDYNDDDKIDLFFNIRSETNKQSIYLIDNILLNQHMAVKNVQITNASVYSCKILSNLYGIYYVGSGDLDNNGADDLVFEQLSSDGSQKELIIIYDSILNRVTSPGGVLNLGLNTDFSVKIINVPLVGNFIPVVQDFDGDKKTDLMVGNRYDGFTYVIFGEYFDKFELNGNTVDWNSETIYNLRIDGNVGLGYLSESFADVDNNGKLDLMLGDNAGSYLYIFLDSFWSQYKDDIGTVLPLNDANNYSLRISYPGAAMFGYGHTFKGQPSDLNGDGKNDFVYNWHKNAVFVIYNSKFDSLAQADKNIDVSNANNYDLRYYYSAGVIEFASAAFMTGDVNGDGRTDLAIGARNASFNGRTTSGSAYLILNFPHDIELGGAGMYNAPFELTGSVTVTNSTTALSSVKWSQDNDPEGDWTECVATDGAFDEDEEDYVCDMSSLAEGSHTIYTKACDNLDSCTVSNDYASVEVILDTSNAVPIITQLGLIKGIPNRDNLYYYFTANKARIYGVSEVGSTIQFERVNGTKYTTQADGSGNFLIIIDLPNGETKLTYSSTDLAGNVSGSRTITLNIDPSYGTRTEDVFEETVTSNEEEVAEETTTLIDQKETPVVKSLLVVDSDGNILSNKTIVIEGKEYKTDDRGYIHTSEGFT